ncbi:MAG: helix-hairpin-helix domain-containing protein [Gemmatimonadetes bacterium]|nr:helix-hairpin-helix domain-containing protein [Gemmatimonadota bacterium]
MPTPAERQAFLYLALVTAVGTAVRAWDGRAAGPTPSEAQALASQLAAVDSALARRAGPSVSRPAAAPTGERARAGVTARRSVPSRAAPSPSTSPPLVGPIDVDRADSATLERLPGIGPALAARIIADRGAHGPFGSGVGLQRVRGIGPALWRRLEGLVTFSGVPRPDAGVSSSRGRWRSP